MNANPPILIAGLGNPGKEYTNTRHNVGFVVVDAIAERLNLTWKLEKKRNAEVAQGNWEGQPIILAKPQTYMNLSGQALGSLAGYFKIPGTQIVTIFDDVTLPFGRIKISLQGGTAGHNGVNSLIQHLGNVFMRFRIGIGGKRHPEMDLADFVLEPFSADEKAQIDKLLPKFVDGVHLLIDKGAPYAMNILHQFEKTKTDKFLSKKDIENESNNEQKL